MTITTYLVAAGTSQSTSTAFALSEHLGLTILVLSVLGIVLNAVWLNKLIDGVDDRDAHKIRRWPIALRSLSSGLAIAYIFMLMIPELSIINKELSGRSLDAMALALSGLLIFNGIQHFCLHRATAAHESMGEWKFVGIRKSKKKSTTIINMSVFAAYAVLIILTLPFQFSHLGGVTSRALYIVTFVLHLGFDALAVSEEDPVVFSRLAIRLLSPALVIAAIIASTAVMPDLFILAAFSLLAGIIISQVFRVEVKEAENTSYIWFIIGAMLFISLHILTFGSGV